MWLRLSEGAAFLVLETLARARRRNATIYGELLTTGQSALARNLLARTPHDEGLPACARQALGANGGARDVDLVLGDGLANVDDDERELCAYRTLFPDRRVPFSVFTGSFGFPGAAAGAFSLVHAMLAMRHGVLPPAINCDEPVDAADVDLVSTARSARPRRVLVWTSDRGIKNAAVVAAAFES